MRSPCIHCKGILRWPESPWLLMAPERVFAMRPNFASSGETPHYSNFKLRSYPAPGISQKRRACQIFQYLHRSTAPCNPANRESRHLAYPHLDLASPRQSRHTLVPHQPPGSAFLCSPSRSPRPAEDVTFWGYLTADGDTGLRSSSCRDYRAA